MAELLEDLRFPHKAFGDAFSYCIAANDLDGDLSVERELLRAEDNAVTAAANLFEKLVAVDEDVAD